MVAQPHPPQHASVDGCDEQLARARRDREPAAVGRPREPRHVPADDAVQPPAIRLHRVQPGRALVRDPAPVRRPPGRAEPDHARQHPSLSAQRPDEDRVDAGPRPRAEVTVEDERLPVRRPARSVVVAGRQPALAASVRADHGEALAIREQLEGEALAVAGQRRAAAPAHDETKTGPVPPRDVEAPVAVVGDRPSVARDGRGGQRLPPREQRSEPGAVGADAVRAPRAVPVAAEDDPVPAAARRRPRLRAGRDDERDRGERRREEPRHRSCPRISERGTKTRRPPPSLVAYE